MISNARLAAYLRFVRIVAVVLVVAVVCLRLESAWAQSGVVHGAHGAVGSVRSNFGLRRIDRPSDFSFVGDEFVSTSLPPNSWFSDSIATYNVGVTEVSWFSREGTSFSAILFYPASTPVGVGKFSAIVFSHGLGASASDFSYLGHAWASRGIVTLCLRHPGSDDSIWRRKIRPMNELREAYERYWSARDRALAIRSGIDFLYASHGEPTPWGRGLDLLRIGVAGNDLGALGALLVAGQIPPDNGSSLKDSRVAGALALSPPVFCGMEQAPYVYGSISVPTMIVTGTEDNGIVGSTQAFQRRIPYDNIRNVDRYLVVLLGGDHRVYGGRKIGTRQANDRFFQETIARETADFFTAYLTRDPQVLWQMRSYGRVGALSNARVERQIGGKI